MSVALLGFGVIVAVLLFLLVLALRESGEPEGSAAESSAFDESGHMHVGSLPQVRQALSREDDEFLAGIGLASLRARVRKERRRVALSYLAALQRDFKRLLRTARVIAALSPKIVVAQELQRMRLTLDFYWRYRIIRMSLWLGRTPLPQISGLSTLLSGYSVRLEAAMRELGERAALVGEMVSSADRRRVNPV